MKASQWKNPEQVEIGQVWDLRGVCPVDFLGGNEHLVVKHISGRMVQFGWGVGGRLEEVMRGRCVGFELPDGRRVMVGDAAGHPGCGGGATVQAIEAGARVRLRYPDDPGG